MKKLSVLVILLAFSFTTYAVNRTLYWVGGSSGAWVQANFKDKNNVTYLPTAADNIIFGGPVVSLVTPNPQFGLITVTGIPNNTQVGGILVTWFNAGGGQYKGTDVTLQGASDLCTMIMKAGGGTGNYGGFIYVDATPQVPPANGYGCKLRFNTSDGGGPKRINLVMEPGTKMEIDGAYSGYSAANSTNGEIYLNLYATCDENNAHPGLILQASATSHAEVIQNTDADQDIYGFIEWKITPFSATPPPSTLIAHYVSSPIYTDATVSSMGEHCRQENCLCVFDQWPFTAGDGDWVRFFDIPTNSWGPFSGNHNCYEQALNFDNSHIKPGTGINIFAYFTYKLFFGKLNNAIPGQEITLPTSGITDNGFALCGNPFSSGLNFYRNAGSEILGWTWGTNINKIIYYWDPDLDDYRAYNWFTDTPTPGDTKTKIPRGQGFFVEDDGTIGGTSHTLKVNNSARTFDVNSPIYKAGEGKENRLYLNLLNGSNRINSLSIGFLDGATMNRDRNDAIKMFVDTKPCQIFGYTNDNKSVSIKMLQPSTGTTTMPVHIKVGQTGSYTINAENLSSFAQNTTVILYDRLNSSSIDLKANPDYTFNATVGDDDHRFDILFSNVLNGISVTPNADVFKIYSSGKSFYIQNNDQVGSDASVIVYDMLGKQMMQAKALKGQITKIDAGFVAPGYYIVTVKSDKAMNTQKVFVN